MDLVFEPFFFDCSPDRRSRPSAGARWLLSVFVDAARHHCPHLLAKPAASRRCTRDRIGAESVITGPGRMAPAAYLLPLAGDARRCGYCAEELSSRAGAVFADLVDRIFSPMSAIAFVVHGRGVRRGVRASLPSAVRLLLLLDEVDWCDRWGAGGSGGWGALSAHPVGTVLSPVSMSPSRVDPGVAGSLVPDEFARRSAARRSSPETSADRGRTSLPGAVRSGAVLPDSEFDPAVEPPAARRLFAFDDDAPRADPGTGARPRRRVRTAVSRARSGAASAPPSYRRPAGAPRPGGAGAPAKPLSAGRWSTTPPLGRVPAVLTAPSGSGVRRGTPPSGRDR
ncbi:hypothetical protein [Saccharothrix sp. HUAS TT1]|uniref:hypothetical protein n=1 Tax=unclassified Saccharothrix TaxID=2593673 RepID=UPI00345BEC6C